MKHANAAAKLTRHLVAIGAFRQHPLIVVDVGARAGAHGLWAAFGDQIKIIGFDPDQEECDRLNATAPSTHIYLCCALDRVDGKRDLLINPYNMAANSFYPTDYKMSCRFSHAGVEGAYRAYIDAVRPLAFERVNLQTKTMAAALAEIHINSVDFIKLDVEAAELDVLEGAGALLTEHTLSLEAEVWFQPKLGGPSFTDVSRFLEECKFDLYDLDLYRVTRGALPGELTGDHRDHTGAPILGYTRRGQIMVGDAFFSRDIIREPIGVSGPVDLARILKAVTLFEVHSLRDCAAEILNYYRDEIEKWGHELVGDEVNIGLWLDLLAAPDSYRNGLTNYSSYLDAYRRSVGRLDNLQQTERPPIYIYGAGKAGRWLKEYLLEKGMDVRGFIVTEVGDSLMVDVIPLADYLLIHNDQNLIMICSQFQDEIVNSLNSSCITNFIDAYEIYISSQ